MSTVFYNGIDMDVTRTLQCDRKPIYDEGSRYVATRWTLRFQCLYNPSATTYSFVTGGPSNPDGSDTVTSATVNNPAFTDTTIRARLLQPQKKFIFTAAGDTSPAGLKLDGLPLNRSLVILECPPSADPNTPNFSGDPNLDLYQTDTLNGPRPLDCVIRRVDGMRTFYVEWAVECTVNETYFVYKFPTVLLAHQWRQTADIDRDGFLTRSTRGRTVFRTDRLTDLRFRPDDFREALAHPIPPNCQRYGIQVTLNEENNGFTYGFTDRELSHNILKDNVTRVEAFLRFSKAFGGNGPADIVLNPAIHGNVWRGVFGGLTGWMPSTSFSYTVRCWGNRNCSRDTLFKTAARVLEIKFPRAAAARAAPGESLQVTFDFMGRYVEFQQQYILGPFTTQANMTAGQDFATAFPELMDDEMGDVATIQNRAGRSAVPGKLSRGTSLTALIAQALSDPYLKPQDPRLDDGIDLVPQDSHN